VDTRCRFRYPTDTTYAPETRLGERRFDSLRAARAWDYASEADYNERPMFAGRDPYR
jgi:hypothetical protein